METTRIQDRHGVLVTSEMPWVMRGKSYADFVRAPGLAGIRTMPGKIKSFLTLSVLLLTMAFAQADYLSGTWTCDSSDEAPVLVFNKGARSTLSVKVITEKNSNIFSGTLVGMVFGTHIFSAQTKSTIPWVMVYENKVCVVTQSNLTFSGRFLSQSQAKVDNSLLEGKMRCGKTLMPFTIHLNGSWTKNASYARGK